MLSIQQTKRKAERLFKKQNPGCEVVKWVRAPKLVTYPTGHKGRRGAFIAQRAEDGAWVTAQVEHDNHGTWVRPGTPRSAE